MTDRERIAELAEILKGRDFDNCIYEDCYDELAYLLVDAGYTHQPEPSPDRVEAVADIIERCLDTDPFDPAGGMPEEIACSILSLFPELKALESNPYNIGSWQGYICNRAYEKGKRDQLAHDQKQIKGE